MKDTSMTNQERFAYVALNPEGKKKCEDVARAFADFLTKLQEVCPEGREMAIVTTKLEECAYFAKKAICRDSSNLAR